MQVLANLLADALVGALTKSVASGRLNIATLKKAAARLLEEPAPGPSKQGTQEGQASKGPKKARKKRRRKKQCRRCQQLGHHQLECSASGPSCGVCAGAHWSQVCIERMKQGSPPTRKCALCGASGHSSPSYTCPAKKTSRAPASLIASMTAVEDAPPKPTTQSEADRTKKTAEDQEEDASQLADPDQTLNSTFRRPPAEGTRASAISRTAPPASESKKTDDSPTPPPTRTRSRSRSRSRTPPSSPARRQAASPRPTVTPPPRPVIEETRSPPAPRPNPTRGQVASDFLLQPKALPPKRKAKKTKKTASTPSSDKFVYGGFSPSQYYSYDSAGRGFPSAGRGRGDSLPSRGRGDRTNGGPGSYGRY